MPHDNATRRGLRERGMDAKTAEMVRGWVNLYKGDTERVARWMRDSLRLGGLKACRAIIDEAVAA
jgi:hypothetical protein